MKKELASIVYQIWPRSFKDSNGDGIGDLGGIIEKLDYLKSLNVTYLWLSPVYVSGNYDYGYDIDDYYNINPEYGTLEQFDHLVTEAKKRGIGIIMDMVANHTSSSHIWFKKAMESPDSPYREYYFFKKGKKGKEPNNWISLFGGSAWTKVSEDEYVLTMFAEQQVDLNWENPKVRDGIVEIMKFWLKRGVSGFRYDVINIISKMEGLPDKNPHKKGYQFADDYINSLPKAFDYIEEVMAKVREEFDLFTVGEGMLLTQDAAKRYSDLNNPLFDMMFQFDLALIDCGPLGKYDFRKFYHWTIKEFKSIVRKWQMDMQNRNYWMANYLSNHDQPRHISHYGHDKKYRVESAKAWAMFNFTLRGTPFMYQGEEIGMTDCKLEMNEWKDIEAITDYKVLQSMMKLPAFIAKRVIQKKTRDNARTPVQWSTSAYAGFSTVQPWIKLNPNYNEINVEQQEYDADSILNFYRRLTRFYLDHPVLTFGSWTEILVDHPQIIAYIREDEHEKLQIIINLSAKPVTLLIDEPFGEDLLTTKKEVAPWNHKMVFAPYEGRVSRLKKHES
ncbi:MAG: glucohydrolase [Firmicutes bacterium HGW-Firmicutes-19]|nr:MAG: glucohydrolase [Firmicutes bacterium HGW-Firmicutes-19]